ncbi:bromodomain-containing protein [Rhizophagus irregularis DAOM 181602=DAOM 197198]|nr:bromodomain-containing protein [Rhizophagus irregularis DAOM 181602=DAOM 197198]
MTKVTAKNIIPRGVNGRRNNRKQILLRSGICYSRTKENKNVVVTNVIVSTGQPAVIPDRVSQGVSGHSCGFRVRFASDGVFCLPFVSNQLKKKIIRIKSILKTSSKYKQESYVRPVPGVPEPELKQTIALRKYLESLCLNEQVLSRELLLRLGTYILDCFVSQGWCRPFINPVPESARNYHLRIARPMDLITVEHKLWAGEYDCAVSKFYDDLAQIIYNAFKFHEKDSVIFKEADSMLTCFVNLTTKFSKPPHDINKLNFALAQIGAKLPHEEFGDVCKVVPNINIKSKIYIVPLYSFLQVTRSGSNVAKLPYAAAERLDPMSSSLFDTFERESLPPVKFQPTETHCNFARLYITKGSKNIKKCRDERNAILVIVKDVSYEASENRLRCNVITSKPFGELRDLDTFELSDARYWTRVALLDKKALDLKVGPKFFKEYLREPFKVSEYEQQRDNKNFLKSLNLSKSR